MNLQGVWEWAGGSETFGALNWCTHVRVSTEVGGTDTWTWNQSPLAQKTEQDTRDICVECWTTNNGNLQWRTHAAANERNPSPSGIAGSTQWCARSIVKSQKTMKRELKRRKEPLVLNGGGFWTLKSKWRRAGTAPLQRQRNRWRTPNSFQCAAEVCKKRGWAGKGRHAKVNEESDLQTFGRKCWRRSTRDMRSQSASCVGAQLSWGKW